MNGNSKEPLRKMKRPRRRVSLPVSDAIAEILAKPPAPMEGGGLTAVQENYALLALYEGLLTLAEHFDKIERTRPLQRSDLVFRFEVVPGVIGRAAQAEQEARAIDALLDAATNVARV